MKIVKADSPNFEKEFARIEKRGVEIGGAVADGVQKIIGNVIRRGDMALFSYTKKLDGVALSEKNLVIAKSDLKKAYGRIDPKLRKALRTAAKRIRAYHERQRRESWEFRDESGARLGLRYTPLDAVCLYVPGGKAAYPSTLLMTAMPAKVAGVKNICVASPRASLKDNPVLLAAAYVAGVDSVYRIGGAQAVAAFAYGTASVPRVAKIVGPGNAWVTEAKRQVFGQVGIDQLAGPSEIVVIADGSADPARVAWDLLSQAEHDESATAVLLTTNAKLAEAVSTEVKAIVKDSPRKEILKESLRHFGRIFVVPRVSVAIELVNRLAPEHVELYLKNPDALVKKIRNAGAIFIGPWTPEAVGDYIAGSNHVLPTAGAARFGSPLGVDDFLKKTSTVAFNEGALRALGPDIVTLAESEGLHAHAGSVNVRLKDRK